MFLLLQDCCSAGMQATSNGRCHSETRRAPGSSSNKVPFMGSFQGQGHLMWTQNSRAVGIRTSTKRRPNLWKQPHEECNSQPVVQTPQKGPFFKATPKTKVQDLGVLQEKGASIPGGTGDALPPADGGSCPGIRQEVSVQDRCLWCCS